MQVRCAVAQGKGGQGGKHPGDAQILSKLTQSSEAPGGFPCSLL